MMKYTAQCEMKQMRYFYHFQTSLILTQVTKPFLTHHLYNIVLFFLSSFSVGERPTNMNTNDQNDRQDPLCGKTYV